MPVIVADGKLHPGLRRPLSYRISNSSNEMAALGQPIISPRAAVRPSENAVLYRNKITHQFLGFIRLTIVL